jgi:hypothetical protein
VLAALREATDEADLVRDQWEKLGRDTLEFLKARRHLELLARRDVHGRGRGRETRTRGCHHHVTTRARNTGV